VDLRRILEGLARLGYGGKIIVESYDMENFGMAPVMKRLTELYTFVPPGR